jgi:hypothetical protein
VTSPVPGANVWDLPGKPLIRMSLIRARMNA